MAPEQLEGIEADSRTDIFFGALLYEMATAKRAFLESAATVQTRTAAVRPARFPRHSEPRETAKNLEILTCPF